MRTSFALGLSLLLAIPACLPTDDGDDPAPTPTPEPVACGGWLGDTCGEGEFCLYSENAICGWADASGTCAPIPEMCTMHYAPVCACDGEVYSNACVANAAGTSALHGLDLAVAADDVVGAWSGTVPSGWEVAWQFNADGTFTKTDLIAPCPPGLACVWSGIVTNGGTWSVSFDEIALSYVNANSQAGATTPASLTGAHDCDGLTLREFGANGETVYSQQ